MKLGNIISITSVKEKTGKTMSIRNLAGTLSEEGKKILIIDFSKEKTDYLEFFEFKKYNDLSKVYTGELSLQTVKLIYPKNRGITLIIAKDEIPFTEEFIKDFFSKVKKTYDYIFLEIPIKTKNSNIKKFQAYATQNIIIIEQELSSIKEINKIIKENKQIENNSILLNKFNYKTDEKSGILMNLEDLFQLTNIKFLGIIEKEKTKDILKVPSFTIPHSNFHLSFKRITQRIIQNKYLKKISTLELKNKFSMEILYNKFDIIEKKSF
jgi:septum formation inhibitor-activating ATPase MinD